MTMNRMGSALGRAEMVQEIDMLDLQQVTTRLKEIAESASIVAKKLQEEGLTETERVVLVARQDTLIKEGVSLGQRKGRLEASFA